MPAPRLPLIITGATGKQGGALISALLSHSTHPFAIHAVSRNPQSTSAKSLAGKPNVKVITGDFDDPDAIFAQVKNPWGLFCVTTPAMGKKHPAQIEEQQGKRMIDAAVRAGVKHIVYTSVDRGADSDANETPIPHFASKKHVEEHIKLLAAENDFTWTILRPVAFMDNISDGMIGKLFVSVWQQNGMDAKLQFISTKDIGKVAAQAVLHADEEAYRNRAIGLAGDDLSPRQAADMFKRVTGKALPSTFGMLATVSKMMMPDELGKMFKWFKDEGCAVDLSDARKTYPFLKSFEQWLVEESAWRTK